MPLDLNTIGGFISILFSALVFGFIYLIVSSTITSLFLSMGLYLGAFHSHYESMFHTMNELVKKNIPEAAKQIQLKACLVNAMNFHTQADK